MNKNNKNNKIDSSSNSKEERNDDKIILNVAEANPSDVGRRIARIDPKVSEQLGLLSGDVLELSSGIEKANVLNWPSHREDFGKGLIRIDGHIRNKLDISINERIEVKKVEAKNALSITLAPTESLRIIGAEEYLLEILNGQLITKGDNIPLGILGQRIDLVVISTDPPNTPLIITESTKITILEDPSIQAKQGKEGGGVVKVTYDDIGGLKNELIKVREMIELPLRHPELFKRLGVEAPKGVLLHGAPGTGKTLLAKAIVNETNANFYSISGPEIMSKFYGESEARLREIFEQAEQHSPSIIFIDELDSIAPKREEVTGEVEKRVVAQLLSLMDGLSSRGKVVVIGATNRVNALDPALRRPGRFDREIELGIPDRNGRLGILIIHTRNMPLEKDVNLEKIADISHGFVGADIQALSKETAIRALRRILPEIDLSVEKIPSSVLNKIVITMQDFLDVLKEIEPSAMREVFVEIPNVSWKEVGGLTDIKQELIESIEWPLKHKKLFSISNATPPKGILLYGPPGTGKTLLAKAVANESEANFISIKGPELLSKWVGESEKGIREVFRKAKQASPCIIFFDEIDAMAPRRGSEFGDSHVTERVISQLLTELDGLEELRGVTVITASNRPDIIDPALLRPGRFDRLLYIPPPDLESRLEIIKIHTKNKPLSDDVDLNRLAKISEGYTGADIASITSTAAILALREHILKYNNDIFQAENHAQELKIYNRHFMEAMKKVKPLTNDELNWYKKIAERFILPPTAFEKEEIKGGIG
ncbi:MAG TPA: CDC48 family AAA ATPase [Nitrososphaeraceae archaeon]